MKCPYIKRYGNCNDCKLYNREERARCPYYQATDGKVIITVNTKNKQGETNV